MILYHILDVSDHKSVSVSFKSIDREPASSVLFASRIYEIDLVVQEVESLE